MAASAQCPIVMGIPHCDSVKKARRWLESSSIVYAFRDVRKQPLDQAEMEMLVSDIGPKDFVNRRSTSWRALGERDRAIVEAAVASPDDQVALRKLIALMTEHQTMIKRPVLLLKGQASSGFSAAEWDRHFSAKSH